MTQYEQLFTVSWSMIQMSQREDWEAFFEAEKERVFIIQQLKDSNERYVVTEPLLRQLISLNQTLESTLKEQRCATKTALLKLKKGKKASGFYRS